MPEDKKTIHVNPVGENWEVESDQGTLGQAETRTEAIEMAEELAEDANASCIQLHTSEGHEEQEIDVPPQRSPEAGENGHQEVNETEPL